MDVSPLDQIKIQAQVLIPLVKALREEMGEEKANDLVRGVLGDLYRKYGASYWKRRQTETPNEKLVRLCFQLHRANPLQQEAWQAPLSEDRA